MLSAPDPEDREAGPPLGRALAPITLDAGARRRIGDRLEATARGRRTRRRVVQALGGVGLVAVAILLVRPRPADPHSPRLVRTAPGDNRMFTVGERAVAFVSENSDLDLVPGGLPAVRMRSGAVHLVVRRDPEHPFVVATPDAHVAVLGTEFDVTVEAGATEVRVTRGEVEVENDSGRRRLWPREAARVVHGEGPRPVRPPRAIVIEGVPVIETTPGRPPP